MSTLSIRPATVADAATLHYWDSKPHIKQAVSNDGQSGFDADWEAELVAQDESSEFLIAELADTPIGAMQIINPATEATRYWGEVADDLRAIDIWIGEERYLAQGYGRQMMSYAINRCFSAEQVSAILIDPLSNNIRAHRFYRRLGFCFVEQRVFDEHSDCYVFRLERSQWNGG